MEIFATLLAGLGLFFIGVKFIGDNLKQMTGRRFRTMVAAATEGHARASALGFAAGTVTQSVNAVIFILITLMRAGLLDLHRAIPVIAFANLGTSVLVVLSTISMHVAVLILVGIAGLAFYFDMDRSDRYRHLVGALLGVGLLFLGLDFIKYGAAPLKEMELVHEFMLWSDRSLLLLFLLGCGLTVITQSGSTVTIITIALTSVGLLSVSHAMLAVYGAGLGAGLAAWLMGARVQGEGRQLILFQLVFKSIGTLVLLILYAIEQYGGVPLVQAGLELLTGDSGMLLALTYIVVQLAADVVFHFVHGPVVRFIRAKAPPSEVEVLGRPRYLYDEALGEPESALVLVDREQRRLVGRLPQFLDEVREAGPPARGVEVLRRAGADVAEACDRFLTDLVNHRDAKETLDTAMLLKNRNRLINSLQWTLQELVEQVHAVRGIPGAGGVEFLVEPLHMLLLTLDDAVNGDDEDDRALLRQLTRDRGSIMDGVRRRLLDNPGALPPEGRQATFTATTLFERCVWLLREFLVLTDPLRERRQVMADGSASADS